MHFTLAVFVPQASCSNEATIAHFIEHHLYPLAGEALDVDGGRFDGLHLCEATTVAVHPGLTPRAYYCPSGGWQEVDDRDAQRASQALQDWRRHWQQTVTRHHKQGEAGLLLYFDCHR